jgi:hypothetical protein
MQTSKLLASTLSAWGMTVAYDWIEMTTGIELRFLPYLAIVALMFGIYSCCRDNNETAKEEV